MGRPKALVRDDDGTSWLQRSVSVLREGGCARVVVVLGAGADDARLLLDEAAADEVVVAEDWATGMSASLRAGLRSLGPEVDAALVSLVDLPDVGAAVVARVVAHAAGPQALARAVYAGRPGHPVLLGRDHWSAVLAEAAGDEGAKGYLAAGRPTLVECGDLATGRDVDSRG
jgi:CTP:molybdopterin cytidylyltransferase MocA